MALRWKKNPPPSGLAGVGAGEQGSTLRDGNVAYARTYRHHFRSDKSGWYWTARNDENGVGLMNTCDQELPDEKAAKDAAMAYVKECIEKFNNEQKGPA